MDMGEIFYRVSKMFEDPEKSLAELRTKLLGKGVYVYIHGGYRLEPVIGEDGWYRISPKEENTTIFKTKDVITSISIPGKAFLCIGDTYSGKVIVEFREKENKDYQVKLEDDEYEC